jgi:hypothetical protein
MSQKRKKVVTAEELLRLMTQVLGDESRSRIIADYGKFKPRVGDLEARILAALKYLKNLSVEDSEARD